MSSRVLLLLGGGANVGASVAKSFAANGYKVALVSRTRRELGKDGVDLHIQGDLSDSNVVAGIFSQVETALGPPAVVVYNAAATAITPIDDPLQLSMDDLNRDFQVNAASLLAAARQAVLAFDKLPASASRTFIYTGNMLNLRPMPPLLSLGMGKSAAAHLVASCSEVYGKKGYRFYYADERKTDGSPAFVDISGEAHGDFYNKLATGIEQVPWHATFVGGKGYVDFGK